MFPVIILGINTRAPSSLPVLDLLCLTSPSFESFPVIGLLTVVMNIDRIFASETGRTDTHYNNILGFAQVAYLALSLLTNIFATSLIAVKAWYVPTVSRLDGRVLPSFC